MKVATKKITYEKFKDMVHEDQKAHLINGEIFMETPASFVHEKLFWKLGFVLRGYVSAMGLGVVLGSRTLVKIDEYNAFEPDLLFISKDRLGIIKDYEILGAPDMVVEIISKSSRREDRVEKFLGYERIGVKEYWLIDPEKRVVEFYELKENKFSEMNVEDDIFRSKAVPGFWLKISWIFDEKTSEFDMLNEILKTPKKR